MAGRKGGQGASWRAVKPALSFGIGPQITIPTATDDALGGGKWSPGLSSVPFNASSKVFQWSYLLGWQASVAVQSEADVSS